MSTIAGTEPGISIPGMSSHFLDPTGPRDQEQGRLRYLTGGSGAPLVLLHTVRTQAEHFRHLIPLVQQNYTVYALDLPGMGYSQIVPGASYEEPAMRAAVKRLVMRSVPDETTRLAALKQGEIDIAYSIRGELAEGRHRNAHQDRQHQHGDHQLDQRHAPDPVFHGRIFARPAGPCRVARRKVLFSG